MKSSLITKTLVIATACLAAMGGPLGTAQTSSLLEMDIPTAEKPKTAAERLEDLQARHRESFAALTGNLNRIPTDSGFLGSKALFNMVDESSREMKNIRSACGTLMGALRAEAKSVGASASFSDEQKRELLEAAESLAKDCTALSETLDQAIQRLGAAYTIFPKWNSVHKSYRNLQGEAKASAVIKAHVEEYLKSFTPAPSAESDSESQEDPFSEDA